MRINKVSVENFKCFKAVDIELGKLTLLTGANSSGKSSILYSILGALQSGEFPFQFSPNGKYVNMGNFREISHKHEKDNIIKIGFEIVEEKDRSINFTTYWEEDKVRKLPLLHKMEVDAGFFNLEIARETKKYSLRGRFNRDIFEKEQYDRPLLFLDWKLDKLSISSEWEMKHFQDIMSKSYKDLERVSNKVEDDYFYSIISYLLLSVDGINRNINFINSFRYFPERTYYETTKTDLTVGKFGEDYINQIILWETQKAKEFKELIKIMKSLSLFENIKSKRLEGGRFEILVKVKGEGVSVSLNDVGFGISQFLPVVVADLQLGKNSTLFVAQPEIHLHPGVQANLGNYMIEQIKQANKNYVIETHSEYLLNRIRLGIVKKEIPKEDVRVYYLQNDGQDVVTYKLEFTEDGQILNAPEDFFKTYMMDVMQIAMKVAE